MSEGMFCPLRLVAGLDRRAEDCLCLGESCAWHVCPNSMRPHEQTDGYCAVAWLGLDARNSIEERIDRLLI